MINICRQFHFDGRNGFKSNTDLGFVASKLLMLLLLGVSE